MEPDPGRQVTAAKPASPRYPLARAVPSATSASDWCDGSTEPVVHLVVRQHLIERLVGIPAVTRVVDSGAGRGLSGQALRRQAEIGHSSRAFGLSASTADSAHYRQQGQGQR